MEPCFGGMGGLAYTIDLLLSIDEDTRAAELVFDKYLSEPSHRSQLCHKHRAVNVRKAANRLIVAAATPIGPSNK